jgi:hypothetical protein
MWGDEVATSDEETGIGRSDKGWDGADDEQNVERASEAGVNGRAEWCSQRGRHGVDGPSGIEIRESSRQLRWETRSVRRSSSRQHHEPIKPRFAAK